MRSCSYLGVALVDGMRDGLHKVVSHASLWVTVLQLHGSFIAAFATANGLDQAQQGAAHQEQRQTRGKAARDAGLHDGAVSASLLYDPGFLSVSSYIRSSPQKSNKVAGVLSALRR